MASFVCPGPTQLNPLHISVHRRRVHSSFTTSMKGKKRAAPDESVDDGPSPSKKAKRTVTATPQPTAARKSPRKAKRPRSCANAQPPTIPLKPSIPLVVSPLPIAQSYKLGAFDFYAIDDSLLQHALLGVDGKPQYNSIHRTIDEWSLKGVTPTARVYIPDVSSSYVENGRMICRALRDDNFGPMHEIVISDLQVTDPIQCPDLANFPAARQEATVAVSGRCFVADVHLGNVTISGGTFQMNCTPVWTADGGGGEEDLDANVEIFEAHMDMAVKFKKQGGQRLRCGLLGVRSGVNMGGWDPNRPFTGFYANLDQAPLPFIAVP